VMKGMQESDTLNYADASNVALDKAAIDYADAVVYGAETIHDEVLNFVKNSDKPTLDYNSTLDLENYYNFYQEVASDILISVA